MTANGCGTSVGGCWPLLARFFRRGGVLGGIWSGKSIGGRNGNARTGGMNINGGGGGGGGPRSNGAKVGLGGKNDGLNKWE
ncbi:hypothetical protein T01_10099 [Trichinella spiralis]|uniref:Uncharacterized protein n=1 Tax=Trichinella spiralis TaxID=6334 RepID=A0A0V1AVM5_TRISP|nr:hypothetical protein T01_10099 [Trichinella spiralis]